MQKLEQALGFFFSYLLTHIDKTLDIASGVLFWAKGIGEAGRQGGIGDRFLYQQTLVEKA